MEDKIDYFAVIGFIVIAFGFILGIILGVTVFEFPKMSGQYLNYRNELYKKVPEEELDNIIFLEMK